METMKQILFYETPSGYYGYKTVESQFKYAVGCKIIDPMNGTIVVIKSIPATPENYQYAKKLMSFSSRHGGFDTFKYNLDRKN